jgi:hypothetical protein
VNPDVKQRWVSALRSGEYKQGIGYLNRADKFCCLGVLCDISEVDQWDESLINNVMLYQRHNATLPPGVVDWAGWDDDTGRLVAMNDSGESFMTIADYIEENL